VNFSRETVRKLSHRVRRSARIVGIVGTLMAILALPCLGQDTSADLILYNGKVVTVDEKFTIAQAVAVRADRISAVGSNDAINRLAGPNTRRIDLGGHTVLPGFIDNHMHLLRFGTSWKYEVRLDDIESRKAALAKLSARAKTTQPGGWIYTLGGWTLDQFADDSAPFRLAELDAAAPNNPVLLQSSYFEAYLNSQAIRVLAGDLPNTPGVELDSNGRLTGRVNEQGFRSLVDKLPVASDKDIEAGTRGMLDQVSRLGLTAFGAIGCEEPLLNLYREWAVRGELNVRVFCVTTPPRSRSVDEFVGRIGQMKLYEGDNYVNHVAIGENFGPLNDPMFQHRPSTKPEDAMELRRILAAIAAAHLPLHVHVNFQETIDTFLDQIESVNKEYPIRNLRWMLVHFNQPTAAALERMKRLGIYAAVNPWAVINGGINLRQFGDAAYDMAPLAMIQSSGITWGLGSDGSRANQINPFETLSWAVTGKMVDGKTVLRQTISREDALIAHTRKNAYFIFQEDNLGSIQPGKLADLIVTNRDYLTVPADEIKLIKPLMTISGGHVLFDDILNTATASRNY